VRTADHAARHHRRERGSGVFGTAAGVFVFLLLLLSAVNVITALSTRSMATNAAHDAARRVAAHPTAVARADARSAEDARFRSRAGVRDAALLWQADDPDVVVVRVVAAAPSVLPAGVRDLFGIGDTDREIRVRVERER
jgi:Na+-transporting methylmalonyl-CoA/oxaloacetate decarboxylase gamma subunit